MAVGRVVGQTTTANAGASNGRAVAFVGVHVVPMDSERVLNDQTVVVEHGRITAVGARRSVTVPDGAQVVAGNGRFLMPGLVDFHTHFFKPSDMLLYVANGVTTVANFGSRNGAWEMAWRDSTGTARYSAR